MAPLTVILVTALIALAVLRICSQISYNLFFSPLRKIPGHWLAKTTGGYLKWKEISGDRTTTIHKWHQQYGPAIRIGPNELSFSDAETVKEIYGQQTSFQKAPIYEFMTLPPLGVFSLINKNAHSQRRRLLSHAFSQSNLLESEPLIRRHIQNLLMYISTRLEKPVDMLKCFRFTAFDIVGELFLGQSFGGIKSDKTPEFLKDADRYFMASGLEYSFPWLFRAATSIPLHSVQYFFGARQRLVAFGRNAFYSYVDQYGRTSGRRDLLTKILSVKPETGSTQLTDQETYNEIGNLVFAGTDTTSTTLTYLFWELAENPEWQNRVRQELQINAQFNEDGLTEYKDLSSLPILDAIVNEANRLHPAALGSLWRESPAGGRMLAGHFVPPKVRILSRSRTSLTREFQTVVSMQCYTTHRDAEAFPDPEAFKPERWMEPSLISNHAKELYMPFSKGGRACLGKNLAVMELKLITAILVNAFVVTCAADTSRDTMATMDYFILTPKAGKCNLVFTKALGRR